MRPNNNHMKRGRGRGPGPGGQGGQGHQGHQGHMQQNRNGRVPLRHQTFDSNGPDVRVRGNAYQVYEKYSALARDAASAGDRIAAESYYQHAEHYYRIINANSDAAPYVPQHLRDQMAAEQAELAESQPTGQPASGEDGDQPVERFQQPRPERSENHRPERSDQPRPERSDQPRPERSENYRPERSDQPRHERGERGEHHRGERAPRGDRFERGPRPDHRERPERQDRPVVNGLEPQPEIPAIAPGMIDPAVLPPALPLPRTPDPWPSEVARQSRPASRGFERRSFGEPPAVEPEPVAAPVVVPIAEAAPAEPVGEAPAPRKRGRPRKVVVDAPAGE